VQILTQKADYGACFTSTRVQILTQLADYGARCQGMQFTCFTGTKVQILTLQRQILAHAVEELKAAVAVFLLTYAHVC
jgi:hypothetical protein